MVGVRDNPPPVFRDVVFTRSVFLGGDVGLAGDESITGKIIDRSGRSVQRNDIGLNQGVAQTINHRIKTEGENVLVILGIDVGCDGRTEGIGLVIPFDVDLQDTRQTNFELNVPILIEVVVEDIL